MSGVDLYSHSSSLFSRFVCPPGGAMNGLVHSSDGAVNIKLRRGPAGLGFNIVGGLDQQYVANDCGIYVSKIKGDGAAALDGRLQEGDKILAINGVLLENRTHRDVVELFRAAGENVELRVSKKAPQPLNGPTDPDPDHRFLSHLDKLLMLAATAAVFAFIYSRLK